MIRGIWYKFIIKASFAISDVNGGNLLFLLVNARYERGAMILTSNRSFAQWGEVFGDPVVATTLRDRLLHHAVVI
jgi:DNA replication protein DnaC